MPGKINLSFKDYSDEGSSVAFYTDDITAGNLAAQTALMDALVTAVEGLTLGKIVRETLLAIDTDNGDTPASDVNSQRERKWLLRMVDSVTGDTVTATIPCADLAGGHLATNSDVADMTNADWVSLKSAIDGNYNNPATGNSLTLQSAKKVGRNL
jgi:hypothetical protein